MVVVLAKNQKAKDTTPANVMRDRLVDLIRQGTNIADGLKIIGRSRSWYEGQRRQNKDWAEMVDKVRAAVSDPDLREQDAGEFEEFSNKYLNSKLFPHHLNMVDLLEGRDPRWLDPGMIYEKGSAGHSRVLITVPPNHAKSTVITMNYVLHRIIKDPDASVIIVSKTQALAQKMLYGIKSRLTHPAYADLQLAFAPVDGWKASSEQWSASKIYLDSTARTGGEKDPTVEALGFSSQIYGARSSLIVCDDVVTLANANEHGKQMDWLRQEAATRLGPGGQLLVVGTRVAPVDLYSELRNPEHYADGDVPWTYLSMPAVLNYSEDPENWRTLWPVSDVPFAESDVADEDGNYPRWTGPRLSRVRNEVGSRKWSLVYMNQDVDDEATFDAVAVKGSVDAARRSGPLDSSLPHNPPDAGTFYRISGIDPAIAGNTAITTVYVDRRTGDRYVADVSVLSAPTPDMIREEMRRVVDVFKPHEFIVEVNGFQGFLAYDTDLNQYMANKGVVMKPHRTGENKQDPDFGVASMSMLFGTVATNKNNQRVHNDDNLIHLPNAQAHGVKILIEELIAWSPHVKTKNRRQDAVMSLWFCELRAREIIERVSKKKNFGSGGSFISQRDLDRRMTVNLDEMAAMQHGQFV